MQTELRTDLAENLRCPGCMYTSEIMEMLRTLNWLDREHRCLAAESTAAGLVQEQQLVIRDHLPHSVLSIHDRFAARGKPSVVPLAGSSCSACHLKLPSGELGVLKIPGRYTMCPNCSVFVWSGEPPTANAVVPPKKTSRRKAYA